MLFRKRIPRSCTYCQHGTKFNDEQVLCIKKGVVNGQKPCRKFLYDPCKRTPVKMKPLDFTQFEKDDFTL